MVSNSVRAVTSASLAILTVIAPSVTNRLVAKGAVWKYLDNGTDQGTAWRGINFNDSAWSSGPAELGYGDAVDGCPEATVVGYGGVATNKYVTTYFRRHFTVSNAAAYTNLSVRLLRDDGGIVYLNGVEVFRSNMPTGAVTYLTFSAGVASDDGTNFYASNVSPARLVEGTNVVAVEIHQANRSRITC